MEHFQEDTIPQQISVHGQSKKEKLTLLSSNIALISLILEHFSAHSQRVMLLVLARMIRLELEGGLTPC